MANFFCVRISAVGDLSIVLAELTFGLTGRTVTLLGLGAMMKSAILWPVVPLAAMIATIVAYLRFTAMAPGLTFWVVVGEATLIPKLIIMLCALLGVTALILTATGLLSRRHQSARNTRLVLAILGFAAIAFGALGALYGYSNIQLAIRIVGSVSPAATAPGYSEILTTLMFGFAAATISWAGRALLTSRP